MSSWFVTRHSGAKAWANAQKLLVDHVVTHLDLTHLKPGDLVIGILPIQMIAAICALPARYLHLVIDVPAELRGVELSAEQMRTLGARLEAYEVKLLTDTAITSGQSQ
jgi:CRISPR-associated protein Csx16